MIYVFSLLSKRVSTIIATLTVKNNIVLDFQCGYGYHENPY